jgi:hypothetical protein
MGSVEPSCTRCGHAQREHGGSDAGGRGCTSSLVLDTGFALGRCGCPGYTRDAAALWDPVPVVDRESAELDDLSY